MNEKKLLNVNEKIKELKEYVEFYDNIAEYSEGYICDIISEVADNKTPIYNDDIIEEFQNDIGLLDEVVAEHGTVTINESYDLITILQMGLYSRIEKNIYFEIENDILILILEKLQKQNINLIDNKIYESIKYFCDNIDTNDRLEDIIEDCFDIIK